MTIEEIKIGDKIYSLYRNRVDRLYTVIRLTNTMIICENDMRFKIKNGRIDLMGTTSWNMCSYILETPELKEEYEKKKLKLNIDSIVSEIDYKNMSLSDLQEIKQILSKYEQ